MGHRRPRLAPRHRVLPCVDGSGKDSRIAVQRQTQLPFDVPMLHARLPDQTLVNLDLDSTTCSFLLELDNVVDVQRTSI